MTPADQYSSTSLLERLAEALSTQQSGTFFIATQDNASCRFALDNGKITHFAYKRFHGLEAIKEFATILSGRWSFSEAPCPFRPNDSVEHYQAVELLGVPMTETTVTSVEPVVEVPSQPAVVETAKPARKSRLSFFYRGGHSAVEETPSAEPASTEPAPAISGVKNRFYRGGFSL